MTPNPTKEEIDALEREIQQQRKKRESRVHRAVNPERYSARIMKAVIKREQGDACI